MVTEKAWSSAESTGKRDKLDKYFFFFINNQASAHLISVASLAGPISERVVKPVALQK